MSHTLTTRDVLSGVFFAQNQTPADDLDVVALDASWAYQEFIFPANYIRGTDVGERIIPDLTGVQVCVNIDPGYADTATLDWRVDRRLFGTGWVNQSEGIQIASHADGDRVWFEIYFDSAIRLDENSLADRWRFGIKGRTTTGGLKDQPASYDGRLLMLPDQELEVALVPHRPVVFENEDKPAFAILQDDGAVTWSYQQGVSEAWLSAPNPLATVGFVRAHNGAEDPLLSHDGQETSLMFRLLAATADSGTDFLGNSYRSAIKANTADAVTSSFSDESDTYWFSKPNPSRFAVETLYFDLRDDDGNAQVVDRVLLDPVTPGVYCNIYYSDDEFSIITKERVNDWVNDGTAIGLDLGENIVPWTAGETLSVQMWFNTTQPGVLLGQWVGGAPMGGAPPGGNVPAIYIGTDGRLRSSVFWHGVTTGMNISPTSLNDGEDHMVVVTYTAGVERLYIDGLLVDTWVIAQTGYNGSPGSYAYALGAGFAAAGSWELYPVDGWAYYDGEIGGFAATPAVAHDAAAVAQMFVEGWPTDTVTQTPTPTAEQWEEKIWTHIPKQFKMLKQENHVLPKPITTKYLALEFSHLQPRPYSPGFFQQAIRYKKHPRWVFDYFLARTELDQYTSKGSGFIPRQVGVTYNAIDLAYNYRLDDLAQEPDEMIVIDSTLRNQAIEELSEGDNASFVDTAALDLLKLSFAEFQRHPAFNPTVRYLLSDSIQTIVDNYPVELPDLLPQAYDVSALQNINRDAIIYEQGMPVMFFFIPSRHRYKEVEAQLSHERAYFVGLRQVSFSRERYMVANDTNRYVETMGDAVNMELTDFVRVEGGGYAVYQS